jgi:hypothetical protein
VIDVLETALKLTGAAEYVAGLLGVAKAVHAFAEESTQLFRTEVIFKNLGVALPTKELQAFSDQLAKTTATSRSQLEGAAGLLARTGLGAPQIEAALATIADTAKATGDSIERVTEAFNSGVEGRGRALRRYGFEIQDTGSKLANFARIEQQLNQRFEGAGAAARNTLGGAFEALGQSLERFFSTVGSAFGPALIFVLNKAADLIDVVSSLMEKLLDFLHKVSFGAVGSPSSGNPAA